MHNDKESRSINENDDRNKIASPHSTYPTSFSKFTLVFTPPKQSAKKRMREIRVGNLEYFHLPHPFPFKHECEHLRMPTVVVALLCLWVRKMAISEALDIHRMLSNQIFVAGRSQLRRV